MEPTGILSHRLVRKRSPKPPRHDQFRPSLAVKSETHVRPVEPSHGANVDRFVNSSSCRSTQRHGEELTKIAPKTSSQEKTVQLPWSFGLGDGKNRRWAKWILKLVSVLILSMLTINETMPIERPRWLKSCLGFWTWDKIGWGLLLGATSYRLVFWRYNKYEDDLVRRQRVIFS